MTPRDPRTTTDTRRVSRLTSVATFAVIAIAAAWAFRPLVTPQMPTASLDAKAAASSAASSVQLALDTRPFGTPLWVAPPAPPPAPTPELPPPPPPPLKLQLIAIVREPSADGATPVASVLLYDPDADRLLSLKEGDTLDGGRTIAKITDAAVQIREPNHHDGRAGLLRTLVLNDAGNGGGGP